MGGYVDKGGERADKVSGLNSLMQCNILMQGNSYHRGSSTGTVVPLNEFPRAAKADGAITAS